MSTTRYLPSLIGLTGPAGSGKDTAARYLEQAHGYRIVSFAAPIRAMLGGLLGYVGEHSGWMTERELKEQPIPGIGRSYRELAQTLGTEWGRNVLGTEFWLDLLATHCTRRGGTHFVVTDVRFPNELQLLRAADGVIWQLLRHGIGPVRDHVSESALGAAEPDACLLNSGTAEQLHERIEALLAEPSTRRSSAQPGAHQ